MVAARLSLDSWNTVSAALPLDIPLATADRLLTRSPERWLPQAAEAYERERDTMTASIGLGGMLAPVRRRVRVTLGPVTRAEGCVRRHLAWEAASQTRLFPIMEGAVTVSAAGGDESVLEVRAHYQPPLGRAGQLADRALLHLVAAASIRRFATEVRGRLVELAGPDDQGQA